MSWNQRGAGAWGGAASWGNGGSSAQGKGGWAGQQGRQGSIAAASGLGAKIGATKIAPYGGAPKVGGISAGQQVEKAQAAKAKCAQLTATITSQETSLKPVIEAATKAMENDKATPASLKIALDNLEKKQTALNEAKQTIVKETAEARKVGPAAASSANDMGKLLIKCNGLCQQVLVNMNKLKPRQVKAQNEADNKVKEVKDAAAFKPILAKANADITGANAAVNSVTKLVDPLVLKPPEGEELDKKVEAIEKAAEEAAKKCEDARKELNEKIKAIQAYAPETKKKAQADLNELQKKLSDSLRKCHVYKRIKVELPKIVANQKAVVEVTEKLAGHESAITKADTAAKKTNLSAKQVKEIDELLEPVQQAIKEANITISQKIKACDAGTQEKFTKLKTRGEELKKKVDAVTEKVKAQRDVLKSEEAIETAKARMEKIEEAWKACQEAEMPFLTGLEILPGDVNESALKDSNEAIKNGQVAVTAARSWVSEQLRLCKSYEKDLAKTTTDALTPFLAEIKDLETKVSTFRRETNERTVTSTVAEVVSPFEGKVRLAVHAGKELASKELEDKSSDAITAEVEKTKAALEEAKKSSEEAHKLLQTKKSAGGAAVAKIHQGLREGQDELNKLKGSVASAEKLVKAKAAIPAGEEAMKAAESSTKNAKKLVPAEGISMEQIAALDEACVTANKAIKAANDVVMPYLLSAPAKTKEALQALSDRKKAAQETINQIKVDTKERREETLSTHMLEEAEAKTKAAETAAGKLDDVEGPFLVGASHALKKTQEILAKCAEATKEVQEAIAAARQHSSQKANEARQFGEASAKKVKEGFVGMAQRMGKTSARLETFKKDTAQRTRDTKVVEAGEKVDAIEAIVKKTLAAIEPFEKEGAENMSEADAAAPLKVFMDLNTETRKQMQVVRSFLSDCQREQKGNNDQLEALKKLSERINTATKEISDKKAVTASHEQKALGSRLLGECKEEVAGLDAEIKKATVACAALLEKGGEEFLTASCVKTLIAALRTHMAEKELTDDALFKDAGGKKMKQEGFVKYLAGLPEAIGHDELSAFSEARQVDMFKSLSGDGKYVTEGDFKAMFAGKYNCIKAVALTNQFAVEGSETICMVEANAKVQLVGASKEDESGMVRSECKVDGKTGWITVNQKKGPRFLVAFQAFASYCTDAEKAMTAANGACQQASSSLNQKMNQGGKADDGSRLKEARDEMAKLKEPLAKAQKEARDLVAQFNKAKQEYSIKEKTELNAHIAARNAKEAAPFVDGPKAKMEAVETAAKAAQEAGAAMINLSGEELEAFATPASVLEAVEKHAAELNEKATEARETVKEQQTAVNEVKPQTGGTAEAKKQLTAIISNVSVLQGKTKQMLPLLRNKCNSLVKAKLDPAAEGIRKHAADKKKTPDELFDSLKSGDKIPEKAFCKLLQSLEGLSINAEHAKLITRKLEADGISKDAFIKYVVTYFKVLKTIAFTDGCDISKCKTLRKAGDGEIVECLEGPITVKYEGSEMTRIRGKATTTEGTPTEGWLTVSGSKGTPFLEKCAKPPTPAEKK